MTTVIKNNLTFRELANIALGSPNLSATHLNVLCGLIICLLRKLNCANETVKITGPAAICLKKLLQQIDMPLYKFNYNTKNNSLIKHSKLLKQLEIRTTEQMDKLQEHFQQIRQCRAQFENTSKWDKYIMAYEEISNEPNVEWQIKDNAHFIYRLQQYISKPGVEKIMALEKRINDLRKLLARTKKKFQETNAIMIIVKSLYDDIQQLKQNVDNKYDEYQYATQEIEDMLKCKVDRIAFPALKKCLRTLFQIMRNQVAEILVDHQSCTAKMHPMTISKSKNFCLCCGQISQKFAPNNYKSLVKQFGKCCCEKLQEITLKERITNVQYKTIRVNRKILPLINKRLLHRHLSSVAVFNFAHRITDFDEFNNEEEKRNFLPLLTFRTDMKNRRSSSSVPLSLISFS